MSDTKGYRGYIGSRPYNGMRVAQHVQNLVIRDYCRRHGLFFKLSLVEYAMPNSFLMLEQLMDEFEALDGAVFYSLALLPGDPVRRRKLYERARACSAALHFALEDISIGVNGDPSMIEDVLLVEAQLAQCLIPSEGALLTESAAGPLSVRRR